MERKKTILIAIFINAGLLAVLFVAALTMQDKRATLEDSFSESEPIEKPLYSGVMNTVSFPQTPAQEEFPPPSLLQLPLASAPAKVEEPIVHHLPPALASTPAPISASVSFTEVMVKKGDSLEKIAKGYNLTADELMQFNHLTSSVLKLGQVLKIPSDKTVALVTKPKQIVIEKGAQSPDYYTVKVGDNPWTIAMKHHMKVEELLRINGLNEEKARRLKPGDRLRIR